ncbi:hypothetical protein [Synoicihabitans lomoniglobus]|uniref:Uncharacterized protein n=1 Tax=Synoicihabitans lomoniglobus TaxID=2909285 RepID=A0AAE9ZT20_9BACT|nr:hypothetical protein [Opitutaceae bacterium LMO-M01]WED64680.1 hypothetical protein PXH66_20240 [Opitutaceae bacterium LMO-M01]
MNSTQLPSVTLSVTIPSFQSTTESNCMPATIAIDTAEPNTLNATMNGEWLTVPNTGTAGGDIIFKMLSEGIIFIGIALKSNKGTAGNNAFYTSTVDHTTETLKVTDIGSETGDDVVAYQYLIIVQDVASQAIGYIDPGIINNPNEN